MGDRCRSGELPNSIIEGQAEPIQSSDDQLRLIVHLPRENMRALGLIHGFEVNPDLIILFNGESDGAVESLQRDSCLDLSESNLHGSLRQGLRTGEAEVKIDAAALACRILQP